MKSLGERVKAVLARIKDLGAAQLVESIVLRVFLALFPLIVVAIAVLGFVAAHRKPGGEDLAEQLVRNMKLDGSMADMIRDSVKSAKNNRGATSIVGFVSVLISALSVFNAIAAACDRVWQVPLRGIKDRLYGLLWMLGAAVLIAGVGGASALAKLVPVPGLNALVGFLAGGVACGLLFWWTQLVMTNAKVPRTAFFPGAIFGGFFFALFQMFGTVVIGRILASQKGGPASLGAVLAFLTFLMIFAWMFVLSLIINVVAWERRHGVQHLDVVAPALAGRANRVSGTRSGQQSPPVKRSPLAKLPVGRLGSSRSGSSEAG